MPRAGSSRDGEVGSRHRPRDARAAVDRVEDLLGRVDRVRRGAEHAGVRGRHRAAGRAAGAEPRRGRARDPLRPRRRRRRSTGAASSRARTTSIRTCRRATRSRSTRFRSCRAARSTIASPTRGEKRVRLTRAHLEEDAGKIAARGFPRHDRHRPESRRHAAARDRLRARHAQRRRGGRVREGAARARALDRHLRRQHAGRQLPLRRQRVGAPRRRDDARHALRDQEPQQLPLHAGGDRVRGAAADRADRGRRHASCRRRASTIRTGARRARCAARKTRRTTATSPIPTCRRS